LLVGGSETDIAEYRALANQRGIEGRVIFKGRVKHREVPLYLSLCDVLVAPFPDAPHYRFYMSPIKLFEYMAAGRPIIATALPSIEEIIGDAGILIQPDDAQAICDAVKRYRHDPEVRRQYSSRALARSKQYTWDNRAQRIEVFLKERIR
jgi:glycosyltransferase involved in cell wall biosynthesis